MDVLAGIGIIGKFFLVQKFTVIMDMSHCVKKSSFYLWHLSTNMLCFQMLFSYVCNDSGGSPYFHFTSESKCFLTSKFFPARNSKEELGAPSVLTQVLAYVSWVVCVPLDTLRRAQLVTQVKITACRGRDTEEGEEEVVHSLSSFVSWLRQLS